MPQFPLSRCPWAENLWKALTDKLWKGDEKWAKNTSTNTNTSIRMNTHMNMNMSIPMRTKRTLTNTNTRMNTAIRMNTNTSMSTAIQPGTTIMSIRGNTARTTMSTPDMRKKNIPMIIEDCPRRFGFLRSSLMAVFLFSSLSVFCPDNACAHRVIVFAWVAGDEVFVQSKFGGGKKVKGGRVVVSDLKKNRLLEGKTDANGEFSFRIPQRTALEIEIEAGAGHKGSWTLPAEELGGTGPETEESKEKPEMKKQDSSAKIDSEEVRLIVEEALDKKLKPVVRMLAEARGDKGPSVSEIFGGIGYILGLMGVAAYFRSRPRKDGD